jgi:hypothetical protein
MNKKGNVMTKILLGIPILASLILGINSAVTAITRIDYLVGLFPIVSGVLTSNLVFGILTAVASVIFAIKLFKR